MSAGRRSWSPGQTSTLLPSALDLVTAVTARHPLPVTHGAHTIEFWLSVLTSTGILSFGWTCFALKLVNRLCDAATDRPDETDLERVIRLGRSRRARAADWLWRQTNAGAWPKEVLSIGNWVASGTVIGATTGFFAYLMRG